MYVFLFHVLHQGGIALRGVLTSVLQEPYRLKHISRLANERTDFY